MERLLPLFERTTSSPVGCARVFIIHPHRAGIPVVTIQHDNRQGISVGHAFHIYFGCIHDRTCDGKHRKRLYPVRTNSDSYPDPVWRTWLNDVWLFCRSLQKRHPFGKLGAIGFIVFVDGWRCIIGKTKRLTLTSRIIIPTTLWLSAAGVVLFFVAEPSIQHLPPYERIVVSCFQVMTSITTVGFNTIPNGGLSPASLFLIIMLMVIGASPSGTGGGLKTTTFTALYGIIRSSIRGWERVTFWGKEIPEERMRLAIATIGFYVMALIIGCYLLALAESHPFEKLLFETASALGTVGLSTGITGVLSPIGKLIIIMLMFVGRLGPLVFGIALFLPSNTADGEIKEDLAV